MSLSTTPHRHAAALPAEGKPRPAIAIVCFPGLGGSGVVAAELAVGLVARGHRVHVLSTALPERLERHLGDALVFEPIDVPTSPVFEYAPYDIAVASQLVRLVQRAPIDLIHLHYAVPHASSALLARAVLGASAPAIVTTMHGTDVTQLGAHPSLHAVTAAALAACDGLTAPSSYLRDLAAERFALAAERIEVIPNFVDAARFAPPAQRDRRVLAALFADPADAPSDGPILFHVSNLRPVKRPVDLVDVLARVRAQLPARAVVVGDGPERDAVVRRADELGVRDAIALLGRRDDFETLLGHADGFLLPSQTEGFGVAALEAMAAGVPVFGYAVGGLPEVVAPETGALVPCCDVDNLAAAVVAGIGDPVRRDAMGAAARARATELFGAAAAIERYEAYFHRVLARRGALR